MGRVLVVGSYNASLTVFSKTLPRRGQTVLGHALDIGPGGKGNNQAIGAKRLGADVVFLVKVGDDHFGTAARQLFSREGLPAEAVLAGRSATGVALILVDASGDNMISVAPGANAELSGADLDGLRPLLAGVSHVLCQLECPLELFEDVGRWARAHDVVTVLNPAPATVLDEDTYRLVDVLTPNETELAVLVGAEGDHLHGEGVVGAARTLLDRGAGEVIVTLGEHGAVRVGGGGETWFEPYPAVAIDSTGAGDAFNAGLICGLGRGLGVEAAVDLGMRAGAFCVQRAGVIDGLATSDELDAALPRRSAAVSG